MTEYCVGLDVHKSRSTYVIQEASGTVVQRGECATTAAGLGEWVARSALPAGTRVMLESGTLAFFVSDTLTAAGLQPIVIDAHEVRARAQRPRQKSDRRDAFELCDGGRRDVYRSRVHVPPPALRQLRELLARRRHFVRVQTAQGNAMKKALRTCGQAALARSLRTPTGWQRVAAAVAVGRGPACRRRRASPRVDGGAHRTPGARGRPGRPQRAVRHGAGALADRAGRGADRGPDGARGVRGCDAVPQCEACRQLRGRGPVDVPIGRL